MAHSPAAEFRRVLFGILRSRGPLLAVFDVQNVNLPGREVQHDHLVRIIDEIVGVPVVKDGFPGRDHLLGVAGHDLVIDAEIRVFLKIRPRDFGLWDRLGVQNRKRRQKPPNQQDPE